MYLYIYVKYLKFKLIPKLWQMQRLHTNMTNGKYEIEDISSIWSQSNIRRSVQYTPNTTPQELKWKLIFITVRTIWLWSMFINACYLVCTHRIPHCMRWFSGAHCTLLYVRYTYVYGKRPWIFNSISKMVW